MALEPSNTTHRRSGAIPPEPSEKDAFSPLVRLFLYSGASPRTAPKAPSGNTQQSRKSSSSASERRAQAGSSASVTAYEPAKAVVKTDIVQQLEGLLSIAKAEKDRGELTDSSLSLWLVRQLVASMKRLPRTVPGTSGTSAEQGLLQSQSEVSRARIKPGSRIPAETAAKSAISTSRTQSFRPARASDPGSAKAAHDLPRADHEGEDLQGMAMLRDGWSDEPPRGGTGRHHETKLWQGENADHTPVRSPYSARMGMLSPSYVPRTPQRSFSRSSDRFWLTESPFRERIFSATPARAYSRVGSIHRSQADFDEFAFWPIGGAGGVAYASSSEKSSRRSDLDGSGSELDSQGADFVSNDDRDRYSESKGGRDGDVQVGHLGTSSATKDERGSEGGRQPSTPEGSLVDQDSESDLDETVDSEYSEPEDNLSEPAGDNEIAYSGSSQGESSYSTDQENRSTSDEGDSETDTSQSDLIADEYDDEASQSVSDGSVDTGYSY
ncbi:hypothetical protein PENSPDRAFT_760517 [Peniophora sp. CONT]|nr:hypothetical protein PENSPDRAFT_760517 [Peniophora sp. CONT]